MIARVEGGINWTWYIEYYQATATTVIVSRYWRCHNEEGGHPETDRLVEAKIVEGEGRILRGLVITVKEIVDGCCVVPKERKQYGIDNPRYIFSY